MRPKPRQRTRPSAKHLLRILAIASSLAGCTAGALTIYGASRSGAAESSLPAPVVGSLETLRLVAGSASVRPKGAAAFLPLSGSTSVPDESEIDATHGRVEVVVATLQPGQVETAEAYAGRFVLHQDPLAPAAAHLILSLPLQRCGRPRARRKATRATAAAHGRSGSRSRHLWVSDKGGDWGTSGSYVTTTVRGTRWLTSDQCHQSKVKVAEGVVLVHDLVHNTTSTVTAGQEYVATQPVPEGAGFVPPRGEVLTGETGGSPAAFERQVGKHVAVFGFFGSWGGESASLLSYVRSVRARLLLHLSTDFGYGSGASEAISPGDIARGESDAYLIRLCKELATSEAPVYLALLPEMNQTNNAYSAFNANGSSRGSSNSTAAFKQAWRRAVLIIRGGATASIERHLHALHLPALRTSLQALPAPKVSFLWAPQTAGSPDTPANSAAAYYPGDAYVDIVGTDFYSAFPNFRGLQALYSAHPSKPFGFNEWAMWKSGDPGFIRQFFAFIRSHRRIALIVYNEGLSANGPFRLTHFPAATSALRQELRSPRFLSYPPE